MDEKIVKRIKEYKELLDKVDAMGAFIIRDLNITSLTHDELMDYIKLCGANYISFTLIEEKFRRLGSK